MWRTLVTLILLPALTAAQAQTTQSTSAHAVAVKRPAAESFTYYNQIRKGTTEDCVVMLKADGWVSTPNHPLADAVPVKLDFEPQESLTVQAVRYPKPGKRKFDFTPQPVSVTEAWYLPIQFKVHANSNAALGPHTLRGKLTFQTIADKAGIGPLQQIEVEIPLVVVEHNSKVDKAQWPLTRTPVALIVVLIVLSPVLVPVAFVMMAVCGASTGEIACE